MTQNVCLMESAPWVSGKVRTCLSWRALCGDPGRRQRISWRCSMGAREEDVSWRALCEGLGRTERVSLAERSVGAWEDKTCLRKSAPWVPGKDKVCLLESALWRPGRRRILPLDEAVCRCAAHPGVDGGAEFTVSLQTFCLLDQFFSGTGPPAASLSLQLSVFSLTRGALLLGCIRSCWRVDPFILMLCPFLSLITSFLWSLLCLKLTSYSCFFWISVSIVCLSPSIYFKFLCISISIYSFYY